MVDNFGGVGDGGDERMKGSEKKEGLGGYWKGGLGWWMEEGGIMRRRGLWLG